MKKSAALITTALAAFSFTTATAVYAEEAASSYPDLASELEFTSLSAYAVNEEENRFAFAEGNYIYLFDGSLLTSGKYSGTLENNGINIYYFEHSENISALAFDGETLVFTSDGTSAYTLGNGQAVSYDYTFSQESYTQYNGVVYTVTSLGYLSAWNGETSSVLNDGNYSSLQICGQSLYVICDSVLCRVGGDASDIQVTPLTFEYVDLTQGKEIEVGDAIAVLSTLQTEVKQVTLPAGTYVTKTNLSDLSGQYFSAEDNDTFALTEAMTMLYLGTTSGGVDILSEDGDVYLTSTGYALTKISAESYTAAAAYINTDTYVYSMPYITEATKISSVSFETVVTVNGVYTSDIMQCSFASVTYTDGNDTVTGYVPYNFITEYYFTAESGSYGEAEYDGEYTDDNVILTVCLIMVIVVLAIGGVAYIGYSASVSKRKSKKGDK